MKSPTKLMLSSKTSFAFCLCGCTPSFGSGDPPPNEKAQLGQYFAGYNCSEVNEHERFEVKLLGPTPQGQSFNVFLSLFSICLSTSPPYSDEP